METAASTAKYAFSKFRIAGTILVSLGIAFIAKDSDGRNIARIDSSSCADYMTYQRHVFGHNVLVHFIVAILLGLVYLAAVEGVALFLRLLARAK